MLSSLFHSLLFTLLIVRVAPAQSIALPHPQIALVSTQLSNASQHRYGPILLLGTQDLRLPPSWEIGTRAQVLTEYNVPEFNVMSTNCSFPPPTTAPNLEILLQSPRRWLHRSQRISCHSLTDGSAADPASAGPVVLIANWTGLRDQDYAKAAEQQLGYLLNHAPRHQNGAMSHRNDTIQLWSVRLAVPSTGCQLLTIL
jgi:hypothetical protein